jgi:hypothetical protein
MDLRRKIVLLDNGRCGPGLWWWVMAMLLLYCVHEEICSGIGDGGFRCVC